MASINWKIAMFAPIPSASESTATAVNVGFSRSCRSPKRKSPKNRSMLPPIFILRWIEKVTNKNGGGEYAPDIGFIIELFN